MMKCRDKITTETLGFDRKPIKFTCDLEPGHDGVHMALGVYGETAWYWGDDA